MKKDGSPSLQMLSWKRYIKNYAPERKGLRYEKKRVIMKRSSRNIEILNQFRMGDFEDEK
jgi:hypothetical protein